MSMVVARVAKVEGKRVRAKMAGKPEVRDMINASNAAEAELYRRRQEDFADLMDQRKKKAESERALKESLAKQKEIKRKQKWQEKLFAASTGARTYTLSSLGDGKAKGGTKANQKNRFDVLDRIRSVSSLTHPQLMSWVAFKEAWDEKRRNAHDLTWGRIFAEETKQILDDLHDGSLNALSQWMENERQRVLPDVECLVVPGIDFM